MTASARAISATISGWRVLVAADRGDRLDERLRCRSGFLLQRRKRRPAAIDGGDDAVEGAGGSVRLSIISRASCTCQPGRKAGEPFQPAPGRELRRQAFPRQWSARRRGARGNGRTVHLESLCKADFTDRSMTRTLLPARIARRASPMKGHVRQRRGSLERPARRLRASGIDPSPASRI